jgi:histidine triad (HIT) family protein
VFCGIVAGKIPSHKVADDDSTYAFMDVNPASDGHLLVVPKRHSRDLLDIPPDDQSAFTLTAQRVARKAITELGADGSREWPATLSRSNGRRTGSPPQ